MNSFHTGAGDLGRESRFQAEYLAHTRRNPGQCCSQGTEEQSEGRLPRQARSPGQVRRSQADKGPGKECGIQPGVTGNPLRVYHSVRGAFFWLQLLEEGEWVHAGKRVKTVQRRDDDDDLDLGDASGEVK